MNSDQPPIGIDLGTTYSVVAYLDASGRPVTLPNSSGGLITPSALLCEEDGVVVGREAVKGSAVSPSAFADCFKRDVGDDTYRQKVCGHDVPPKVLSAFVLDQLRRDAETTVGPIKKAVVTVPAFFDESRRKATQDAGQIAGLDVLDIINEPTAAALAYAYQRERAAGDGIPAESEKYVLVYDLGGGTFDVSVLKITGPRFQTVATDGDVLLGGKDFDERLVNFLAEQFLADHGIDPRANPEDAAQLWLDAEEAKQTLSERAKTTVVCYHAGLRSRIELTRAAFEEMTQDLLERTETTTSLVLRQAGLAWKDIDHLLLVGGSSRMPMVGEMLARLSERTPDRSASPDEAVAHGAAIRCGMLMDTGDDGPSTKYELINVNSHSLGIVARDPTTRNYVNTILIPRNTPLPCHVMGIFHTAKEGQRDVSVRVVEGESDRPEECIALGKCVVKELPPNLPKGTKVEVQYSYAADGRISVSARVPATRQSAQVEVLRHRSTETDDLDSWRVRLSGTTASPGLAPDKPSSPTEADLVQQQLDRLFQEIGEAVVRTATPPDELASRVASTKELRSNLAAIAKTRDAAKKRAASAANSAEKLLAQSELAKIETQIRDLDHRIQYDYLAIGRTCAEKVLSVEGFENQLARAQALKGRLT